MTGIAQFINDRLDERDIALNGVVSDSRVSIAQDRSHGYNDGSGDDPEAWHWVKRDRADIASRRAILALHEPSVVRKVAEIGDDGEVRDVEADSAEEILSREVLCMTCGLRPAPCPTLLALVSVWSWHSRFDPAWSVP